MDRGVGRRQREIQRRQRKKQHARQTQAALLDGLLEHRADFGVLLAGGVFKRVGRFLPRRTLLSFFLLGVRPVGVGVMVLVEHAEHAFQFLVDRAGRAGLQLIRPKLVNDGNLPLVLGLLGKIQLALFDLLAQLSVVLVVRRRLLLRRVPQLNGLGQREELPLLGPLGQFNLRRVLKARRVVRNGAHARIRLGGGFGRLDDLVQLVHLAAAVFAAAAVIGQQLTVALHMRMQRVAQALRAAAGVRLLHALGIAADQLAGDVRCGCIAGLGLGRRLRRPLGGLLRMRRGRPQRFVRAGRFVQQRADIQFFGRSAAHGCIRSFQKISSSGPLHAAGAPPRKSRPRPPPTR